MGVLDKFLDAIKLNDEDDDYLDDDELMDEDDDDEFGDEVEPKPKKSFVSKFSKSSKEPARVPEYDEEDEDELPPSPRSKSSSRSGGGFKNPFSSVRSSRPSYSRTDDEAPIKAERFEKTERTQRSSKITPMRNSRSHAGNSVNMEVFVIRPRSMEDTKEIANTLMENSTVILNLEGIDMELAQRIIDFTSGACFSLGGSLQQISSYIFVLAPANVDISGDLQNIMGGSAPSVKAGY